MVFNLPPKVKIVEVGMRDGLQNIKEFIPTREKIKLINILSESGLENIEITSFVSPKWVPQLADSLEVAQGINRKPNIAHSALVPNLKGLEGAKQADIKHIAFFLSASETHSQKNINKSIAEALKVGEVVVKAALEQGMQIRAYLSTVFGCPFDGPTDPQRVLEISQQLIRMGVHEIAISDTTGVANPKQVVEVIRLLAKQIDLKKIAVHFHDTRGSGLANALAALLEGITVFDSSFGGIGGCPFAPGASGNIATEDLVYMFHSMGVDTGINLDELIKASSLVQSILNNKLPSKYLQAYHSPCIEVS